MKNEKNLELNFKRNLRKFSSDHGLLICYVSGPSRNNSQIEKIGTCELCGKKNVKVYLVMGVEYRCKECDKR